MKRLIPVVSFVCLTVWAIPATAQALGRFQDWRAHQFLDAGKRVCTMWTQPKTSEGKYTRRGEVFAFVSLRQSEPTVTGTVSLEMGYPATPGEEIAVSVDRGGAIRLPVTEGLAWTDSPEINRKLVDEMLTGLEMVVVGRSARGTETTDTYSLRGATAAYRAISDACRDGGT